MAEKPSAAIEWDEEAAEEIEWDDAAAEEPGPESVAPEPYGPRGRPPAMAESLTPSTWGTLKDLASTALSPAPAVARGGLQGATLNFAPRAMAAMETALPARAQLPLGEMVDPTVPTPEPTNYEDALKRWQARYSETQREHPGAFLAGELAGGVAVGSRLPAGMLSSAVQGGAAAAGATDDLASQEAVPAVAQGLLLGGAADRAGALAGNIAGRTIRGSATALRRLAEGVVQPTDAARYLQSVGVDNLTVGQLNPNTFLAQMEEAGTSIGGIGPSIKAQRDVAFQQIQDAALREAIPPGMDSSPTGGSLGSKMDALYQGFDSAYAVAKGHAVDPAGIQGALSAMDDPSIYASDATRQQVGKWLGNQLSALRLDANGKVLSDDVLRLRSNVRRLAREVNTAEEQALLDRAEAEISGALDSAMPPSVQGALRETDRQYAKLKTVGAAVTKAGDRPGGFTPYQLSSAVQANTPEMVHQKGGGGPLRELASAGREIAEQRIPLTGARWLSVGPVPYITGPASYAANLPGPKRVLTGQTEWQQAVAGQDWLQELARTNPQALGQWGEYLGAAAARSPEALGAAHRYLTESDPEYQERMRALGGNTQ